MRAFLAVLFFLGLGAPAFAEGAYRDDFSEFFENALGEWQLILQDYDEEGNLTYEGEQVRIFEWGIAKRFVEEKAYITRETGEEVYLGLMLYSLDEETGQTLMVSFWPRSPKRWAEFKGQIITKGSPTLAGSLSSYRTDGIERKRRVEISFSAPDQIVFLNYAENSEGEEFLVERLTYNRIVSE